MGPVERRNMAPETISDVNRAQSAALVDVRYDVRDQWGRRLSNISRREAEVGIQIGKYRPCGKVKVKYLRDLRSEGEVGGDLRSRDASLTTISDKGSVVGFHDRSFSFRTPLGTGERI
jgi:hypothetical protein